MPDHYIITGSSSGLGKAIAEQLLSEGHFVTGISRHSTIDHKNYSHQEIDLSISGALDNFQFNLPNETGRVVLINNAGSIGEVKRCGYLRNSEIEQTIQLNVSALIQLTNQFISEARKHLYSCLIINISSGAAVKPIASWSVYCASKAAVDMFSAVVDAELKELRISNIRIWSVYPGVIDTPMQQHVRSSKPEDFSSRIRFTEYKETGQLADPRLTAAKILGIFSGFKLPEEVVFSIRDK